MGGWMLVIAVVVTLIFLFSLGLSGYDPEEEKRKQKVLELQKLRAEKYPKYQEVIRKAEEFNEKFNNSTFIPQLRDIVFKDSVMPKEIRVDSNGISWTSDKYNTLRFVDSGYRYLEIEIYELNPSVVNYYYGNRLGIVCTESRVILSEIVIVTQLLLKGMEEQYRVDHVNDYWDGNYYSRCTLVENKKLSDW